MRVDLLEEDETVHQKESNSNLFIYIKLVNRINVKQLY